MATSDDSMPPIEYRMTSGDSPTITLANNAAPDGNRTYFPIQ